MASQAVVGVWKLKAYSRRFLDTGEVRNDMLPHTYIIYTPGGHMMSVTFLNEHKAANMAAANDVNLDRPWEPWKKRVHRPG